MGTAMAIVNTAVVISFRLLTVEKRMHSDGVFHFPSSSADRSDAVFRISVWIRQCHDRRAQRLAQNDNLLGRLGLGQLVKHGRFPSPPSLQLSVDENGVLFAGDELVPTDLHSPPSRGLRRAPFSPLSRRRRRGRRLLNHRGRRLHHR